MIEGYAVTPQESFTRTLTTPKGSLIAKPEFGTNFYKLKHMPFGTEWVIELRRALKDACAFDPRLRFKNAKIDTSEAAVGKVYFEVDVETTIIKGSVDV